MQLYDKTVKIYPDLTPIDFAPNTGTIELVDHQDGKGCSIRSWEHPKFQKPTKEQLDAII